MADLPNRTTHRWAGYDYAQQGAYFLTICTQDRLHLFGRIVDGVLQPSPIGELARQCWFAIPDHMPHVDAGEFVVMPNHVHGIVVIRDRLVDVRGRVLDGGVGADGVGARHDAPGSGPVDAPGSGPIDAPGSGPVDAPGSGPIDAPGSEPIDAPGSGPVDAPGSGPVDAPGSGPIDAPGSEPIDAPGSGPVDAPGNADDPFDPMTDDPGTEMPGGDPDTAHTPSHHTRARHDAPLRDPRKPPGIPRGALGQIVASYKSAVTRMAYRDGLLPHGTPVWQRNYWDRVIRDDAEHERIARYIRNNPANWKGDRFNR